MSDSGGFRDFVGMSLQREADGLAEVRLTAEEHHLNQHGTVHGGVIASLADVAMGAAVATTTANERPVTIEMKVTYLEPAQLGVLVATAQLRKRGRRITVVEAEVAQDGGETVAHAIGTFTTVG
jgi:uncharacterized protein (TIGR00369 family)